MFWLMLAVTDPATNRARAICISLRRPYRSDSLPYRGTAMVDARMLAVTTHGSDGSAPSSPTIVGKAVATIVASMPAIPIASSSPAKTPLTFECCGTNHRPDVIMARWEQRPMSPRAPPSQNPRR